MPLLWITAAFIIGIPLGKLLKLPWFAWGALAFVFLFLAIFDRKLTHFECWKKLRTKVPLPPGLVLLFLVLGSVRFVMSTPNWNSSDLAYYNDRGTYTMVAWVSGPLDRRDENTFVQVSALELTDSFQTDPLDATKKVHGVAQVTLPIDSEWSYGDLLLFTASPKTPSVEIDFSYKDFLARQNIHSVIFYPSHVQLVGSGYGSSFRKGLLAFREKALTTIFSLFPQPESGLLAGILLGIDNYIPESLKTAYKDTGTAHIIAISGFNMVVLASLFTLIFTRFFNRYWAAFLAAIAIIVYTLFVDGSPSVIRAAVMAIMASIGTLIGRKNAGLNALSFTAALLLLFNPLLLEDVSFQLSFMATFGLVVFATPVKEWVQAKFEKILPEEKAGKISTPLGEYFLFTLIAQAAVFPVIAFHFGRISLSAIAANPLILPAQSVVLILGGITTLVGMAIPFAGKVVAFLSWPILAYTNQVVPWIANWKTGALTIHPTLALWLFGALILFLLIFFLRNYFKKLLGSGGLVWVCLLLVCACVTTISIYAHMADGNLHFTLLRVGEESAILIKSPSGKTSVVDPGGQVDELAAVLSKELSPWSFHIDNLVLTDPTSSDLVNGLNRQIKTSQVLLAPAFYEIPVDSKPVVFDSAIKSTQLSTNGTVADFGFPVQVLSVDRGGTAFLMVYGKTKILIPNGVDYALIKELAPDFLVDLDVIILSPTDVSYIPPRVWLQINPKTVVWNSPSFPPIPGIPALDKTNRIEIISDGSDVFSK